MGGDSILNKIFSTISKKSRLTRSIFEISFSTEDLFNYLRDPDNLPFVDPRKIPVSISIIESPANRLNVHVGYHRPTSERIQELNYSNTLRERKSTIGLGVITGNILSISADYHRIDHFMSHFWSLINSVESDSTRKLSAIWTENRTSIRNHILIGMRKFS